MNHGPHNWPSSKEIWILWQECDKNAKKSIFSVTRRWRLWEKGNASRSKRWIIDYAALHQQKRHYDFHLILTNWKSCEHCKVLLADVVIEMTRLIRWMFIILPIFFANNLSSEVFYLVDLIFRWKTFFLLSRWPLLFLYYGLPLHQTLIANRIDCSLNVSYLLLGSL